jgi:hypothetical protein
MQFITPVAIEGAQLVSSSLTESEHPAWSAAAEYEVNDLVIYSSAIWVRLTAGISAIVPNADPANWRRVGPTNKWAMFDRKVGTVSRAADSISFTIAPGMVRAIALLDLSANSVTVTMRDGGEVVYARTVNLNTGYGVFDWLSYFLAPIVLKRTVLLTDLPPYSGCEIDVTVNGGLVTELGTVVVGDLFTVGATEYGVQVSMRDFSRKETDEYGVTSFVERPFSKRVRAPVAVPTHAFDEVVRRLQLVRATPTIWVASSKFDQLIAYGVADWTIGIAYDNFTNLDMTIEGLI